MKLRKTPIASAAALTLMGASFHASAQQAPAAAIVANQRNNDSVTEVITAEDIGKLPDKNVADAVQRVPGVTISSAAGGEGGFDENRWA